MSGPIAVTLFVVGMVASIMVHEWGHFFFARRFGMRADRFFVGFGPTVWSTRRGETEYGVKAFPLGGFVRIRGMGDTDERRPPIGVAAFAPEHLAADRKLADASGRSDGLRAALGREHGIGTVTIPDATWVRVAGLLDERGTPPDVAARLLERGRAEIDPASTPLQARDRFEAIVAEELGPVPDSPGDEPDAADLRTLRWRLLRGDEGRFFGDRPPWQRAIVLAMGSILHFLQAFVLLFVLAMVVGAGATAIPRVADVVPDSPADVAGLEVGDDVVRVEGTTVEDFAQARDLIRARAGQATEIVVLRDGERLVLVGTPEAVEDPDTGELVGRFGFVPDVETNGLPPHEAFVEAVAGEGGIVRLTTATFGSLGRVFGPEGIASVFGQLSDGEDAARDPNGGVSLIGAGQVASSVANEVGVLVTVLGLLASINVFVGIFNILPFPPLDGGHLAVLGVENVVNRVRRARGLEPDYSVDQRTVVAIAIPVIALIGVVSIGLILLDITNPLNLN